MIWPLTSNVKTGKFPSIFPILPSPIFPPCPSAGQLAGLLYPVYIYNICDRDAFKHIYIRIEIQRNRFNYVRILLASSTNLVVVSISQSLGQYIWTSPYINIFPKMIKLTSFRISGLFVTYDVQCCTIQGFCTISVHLPVQCTT